MQRVQLCIFCGKANPMTGEHIWSDWMNQCFVPGNKAKYRMTDTKSQPGTRTWSGWSLNITAKVVCAKCNNGWMAKFESTCAKPDMKDMILGASVAMTPRRIATLVAFAFKTAVIVDHAYGKSPQSPFFISEVRQKFKDTLEIPREAITSVFLAGVAGPSDNQGGGFRALYYKGPLDSKKQIGLYAMTFRIGHLALQLVTAKPIGTIADDNVRTIDPDPTFDNSLAVQIWPNTSAISSWPLVRNLDGNSINKFAYRWSEMRIR